ncbi:hypothetical protein NE237_024811 [Protea cynaroides]|uniref:Uncharacterized protein n=1 Tax=Protea cynaroides TaxID=273540 RepID=A0A9Q0H416_9MAGN|nr:hypothetical protein NE237_024811 [Protea cynaroides]
MAYVLPHLLWFLLFLIPVSTSAQSHRNITLGSSLSTHDEFPFWESLSGEFAFGFKPISGKDLLLVAIWFQNVPDNTIVWTTNQGDPVKKGSKIELTDSGIALIYNQGNDIWSAKSTDNSLATSAAMLHTGNFVLRNKDSSIIWSCFANPTDTMLPSQVLDRGSKLTSRLTEGNYYARRFEIHFQANGNLVFYTTAWPTEGTYDPYLASDTVGTGSQSVFNQSGYIYSVSSYVPSNICTTIRSEIGGGACGFNSYCKLDEEQRPRCECPPGYVHLDAINKFNGCGPNFTTQSCEEDGSKEDIEFQMEEIPSTDWPLADYEHFEGNIHQVSNTVGVNLHCFTYKNLEDATGGFKEEVGGGGGSTVYKGALQFDSEDCCNQKNILLDDNFAARICDFGLAKLLKIDQTQTTIGVRGTRGYVAPEWFKNMPITAKVDVYSFGVVLLEIICCRKNVESMMDGEDKEILSEWAYECYKEGNLHLLMGNDEDAICDRKKLERFIMIAIWCIQEDPS